jgi:hypothetical protein
MEQTKLYFHVELFREEGFIDYSSWLSKSPESVHSDLHVFEIPEEEISKFLRGWVIGNSTHDDDAFVIAMTNFEALRHRLNYVINRKDQFGFVKDFSGLEIDLSASFGSYVDELFEGKIQELTKLPQQTPS